MITYIHKDIGFYELESEIGDNFKTGTTWKDYLDDCFVLLDEDQIAFRNINPNATVKEIFDMKLNEVVFPIEVIKRHKVIEVEKYDKSDAVNCFFINEEKMWIDRNTRTSLLLTADILKNYGETHITLWSEGTNPRSFSIPIEALKQMLYTLEMYAKTCYDVTALHKHSINQLTSIVDIENYDYKSNYPSYINLSVQ